MNARRLVVAWLLAVMMMISVSISTAESPESMITLDAFESLMNYAGNLLESGHQITSENLKYSLGKDYGSFVVNFDNTLAIQVSVPHGTTDVNQVWGIYIPSSNQTSEEKQGFLYLIIELLYATDTLPSFDGFENVLQELRFTECMQKGESNSLKINHRIVGIAPVSSLGFMFYIMDETEKDSIIQGGRNQDNTGKDKGKEDAVILCEESRDEGNE